jgi:hypothetical protein
MKKFVPIAVALASISLAAPASAALVLDTTTFTLTADHNAGPNSATINFDSPVSGLTSALELTLTGGTGNAFTFSYNFTKSGAANLVGFGFDTNPNLTSVTGITGDLAFAANTIFPGSGNVEACFYSGNNCSAANGQDTAFSGAFTLNFSGSGPFTLNNFVDRYASISALNNQSGEGYPYIPGIPTQHGAVPEPATWAMMLLGFGGIGMSMRRRPRALMQIA